MADTPKTLPEALDEIYRLRAAISELRGLPVYDAPTEELLPEGTRLVTDYTVHAAMAQTRSVFHPAGPVILLTVSTAEGTGPNEPRAISTLVIEKPGAITIADGIRNSITILDNLANNQERPNNG